MRQREDDGVVAGEHLRRGVLEQAGRPAGSGAGGCCRAAARRWTRRSGPRPRGRGAASSSRTTSPPAYPLAPATATRLMCMTIQSSRDSMHTGPAPTPQLSRPVREPSPSHPNRRGAEVKRSGIGRQSWDSGQVRGSDSPRARTRVRSSGARPASRPGPQRGDGVDAGAHEAPRPRVELARHQRQHQVGDLGRVGPLGAADVRVHRLGHVGAHHTGHQVERPDAARPPREVGRAGDPRQRGLADVVGARVGARPRGPPRC